MTSDDLGDLLSRPTITVTEAAQVLGISRNSAYAAARAGDIPTLRLGARILVPTARLRAVLGLEGGDTHASDRSH